MSDPYLDFLAAKVAVAPIDPRCRGIINRVLPPLPACELCGRDIADRFAMGYRRCERHDEGKEEE
jgi:hypothetical protein